MFKKSTFQNQLEFENECKKQLFSLIISRTLVLILFQAISHVKNPEDFLRFQLNGSNLFESSENIRNFILQQENMDLGLFTQEILSAFSIINGGKKLLCCIDEGNILLSMHENTFSSTKNLEHGCRLLSSFVIRQYSSLNLAFILAGTGIRLRDTSAVSSAVAKIGESAGQTLKVHTNFRSLTTQQVKIFLGRLLNISIVSDLNQEIHNLQGELN